jgi:hypothetical protein
LISAVNYSVIFNLNKKIIKESVCHVHIWHFKLKSGGWINLKSVEQTNGPVSMVVVGLLWYYSLSWSQRVVSFRVHAMAEAVICQPGIVEPGFNPGPIRVKFVVNKVELAQIFLWVLNFSPVSFRHQCFIHIYISFIWHGYYIIIPYYSIII